MVTASWRALGTSVVVGVADPHALPAAREAVAVEVAALDRACSRFREDSDLNRLNRAAGAPVMVSPLLGEAIAEALRAARLTEGAVDPTVGASLLGLGYDDDLDVVTRRHGDEPATVVAAPGWREVLLTATPTTVLMPAGTLLDLGATAKALGADRAARSAHRACGAGVVVALGGDVATAGPAPPEGWSVAVTDDHNQPASGLTQWITLREGGVATSSSTVRVWRRGGAHMHHILDPRTGLPARSRFRTVSVAATTCVDANIASTALMVRGEGAVDWLRTSGLPARLVTHEGAALYLSGWPEPASAAA